jgi:ABC-2 type transport system ATP-binding protein
MGAANAKTGLGPHTTAEDVRTGLAVEVAGVGFSYGDRVALADVSFRVRSGEFFGFLGPNGGGKTTLFHLLATLSVPQSGRICVLGCDLATERAAVRRQIGVVFQNPGLDGKLTALENLLYHGHLYGMYGSRLRSRALAALEQLGVASRAADLVETLSGGLRRRVEAAKALVHDPALLLLDEPSTGLDPVVRRDFTRYLQELCRSRGVTVVLTTHYLEEADLCDRIAVLHRGSIVATGTPAELKAQVGGDVVVAHTRSPTALREKIERRLAVRAVTVDSTVRIEHARGHELAHHIMEAFGGEIDSISVGHPTLEDVFVHVTGSRFAGADEEASA